MVDSVFGNIFDSVNSMMTMLLGIVAGLGALWCGIRGSRYKKEMNAEAKEKHHQKLKNAILTTVMVFLMLAAIKVAMPYAAEKLTAIMGDHI